MKIYVIASKVRIHRAKPLSSKKSCLSSLTTTTRTRPDTHQVIDAQEEGLDAAVALAIPARRDTQIYPHQLRQELQGETSQAVFRAPVQLEQLVAHRLQQLNWRKK